MNGEKIMDTIRDSALHTSIEFLKCYQWSATSADKYEVWELLPFATGLSELWEWMGACQSIEDASCLHLVIWQAVVLDAVTEHPSSWLRL